MVANSPYFALSLTDRVMARVGQMVDAAPHLVLELSGPLDRGALARAIELVTERHPILTCIVDVDVPGARWEPGRTAPVLEWYDAPGTAGSLHATHGPTCHVVHERTATGHRLRVGLHHAVGDGVALLLVADDLRRAYLAARAGMDTCPDVDWSPRTISALLDARRVGLAERARLALEDGLRWGEVPRSTHGEPTGASPRHASDPAGDPDAPPWSCAAAIVDRAVAIGRDRGWRRAPVIVAALAAAWSRAFGDERKAGASVWLTTVNCRRPLGASRGIGNLSGFEPVWLTDVGTRPLPDIVDEATRRFVPFRDLGAGMLFELGTPLLGFLPESALDEGMAATVDWRTRQWRWTRVVSVVDIPEVFVDWGATRALAGWCEPVRAMTGPSVAFVVTRFAGSVSITPVVSDSVFAADDIRRLFDALDDRLERLVEYSGLAR
jgi:hypothetical protein